MAIDPTRTDPRGERVDAAILAYLEAADAGRPPDPREFLARYPDLAPELEAFLADHESARRLTAPLRAAAPVTPGFDTVDEANGVPLPGPPPLPPPVGGYRPLRFLGEGGMGRVYEAEGPSGRRVALKLLAPGFAESRAALERFRQEGRLASRITHPRCVFVLTADAEAGRPYIAMELMSGTTLRDLVARRGPLPPDEAVAKVLDVIEGLEAAHQAGVIHRDVKPANCYVEPDGRVKVGDFGLSRSLTADSHLTRTGGFVGTPLFASPEQLRGEPLDPRTDVYSVAATLYFLLTGQAPFQGTEGAALVARVVSAPVPPPRRLRPGLSPALEAVVLRGLERQRERRFRSLAELRAALVPLLPGRLSIAGLGLRLGAYLLDTLPFAIVAQVLSIEALDGSRHFTLPLYLALVVPMFLYFWLCDGLWGGSPGKRLVGLRVTRIDGYETPGLVRGLARTAVFLGVGGMILNLCLYAVLDPKDHVAMALAQLVGAVVGLALILCPMRARNGYRGLHELLSGTRVVRLPSVPRHIAPRRARTVAASPPLPPAEGLPPQIGPFRVCGVASRDGGEEVLRAEDSALERPVWIWLRPLTAGPLPPARKELTRAGRLRWLAEGDSGGSRWDAFVAPEGERLADLFAAGGPLDWAAVREVLEQLADELHAAAADGAVPSELSGGQVRVQPGRVQLLDHFSGAGPASGEGQALALLRAVAVLALGEGESGMRPVGAAVPLHARRLLTRLEGPHDPYPNLAALRADLAATRDRPTEVTPLLRALHLAISSAFLLVGLLILLAWSRLGTVAHLLLLDRQLVHAQALRYVLDDDGMREVLLSRLPPEHELRHAPDAFGERLRQRETQDRAELQQRLRGLGPLGPLYLTIAPIRLRKDLGDRDESLRIERRPEGPLALGVTRLALPDEEHMRLAGPVLRSTIDRVGGDREEDVLIGQRLLWGGIAVVAFFPVLWILWAFAFRGGLGLRLAGLALVRAGGGDASRLRCAFRALLVWAPVLSLLLPILWIDSSRPDLAWLCIALQGAAVLLVAVFAALALRFPCRCLHDVAAGTYLVPR